LKLYLTILLSVFSFFVHAQTLGGDATYNFLKLPSAPLLAASGGVNVSLQGNDAGLTMNNPALLNEKLHSQVAFSFNSFFAGIRNYQISGVHHLQNLNTTFGGNINFIDYGEIPQTDAAGNVSGNFRPSDYVVQLSAAKKYMEKWSYGTSIKYIHSSYQQYKSSAVAFDAAVLFSDSTNGITASIVAKNMGFQITSYNINKEDLPFDLQAGVTKKLSKAPFAFSLTAHHIHQFDIMYNDDDFNRENSYTTNTSFLNQLVNHLVFSAHVFLGDNLESHIGYNLLRRSELNLGGAGNGLNGFSIGVRAKFKKMHFQYARSYFQRNAANQFGLNIQLNQFFGSGSL
jgi:hypothetical protein